MQNGFWGKLPKPFFAQAPMADVTDAAFRRIIAKYGKPDVMWTEFVSADGVCSAGRDALLPSLWFTDAERPIVAQIFSADPGKIREAAALVRELGFDGVDINMGCPDKNVVKQGAGAALIKTPKVAQEVIRAARDGVRSAGRRIPVSVKTRIGDAKDALAEWLPYLLETEPAAVTVHARTRKEMSKVPARWELVSEAVEIRDRLGSKTLIIGNGDVRSVDEGMEKARESGADGVMVGRGIFGNPWLFSGLRRKPENSPELVEGLPSAQERLRILVEHATLFRELYMNPSTGSGSHHIKSFDVMRKHFKAYVNGFPGAAELRAELMKTMDSRGVSVTIDKYIGNGV